MAKRDSIVFGRKYSCPGCNSQLKFKRPPTKSVYNCPNCRRLLRLREKQKAAGSDDALNAAIGSLLDDESSRSADYEHDRRLDRLKESRQQGTLLFDQPWPGSIAAVVLEAAEVVLNQFDFEAIALARQKMFDGFLRRVTVYRTGEVEDYAVTGHWRNRSGAAPEHAHVGKLPRSVGRQLNKYGAQRIIEARINRMSKSGDVQGNRFVKLFIDLAVAGERNATRTVCENIVDAIALRYSLYGPVCDTAFRRKCDAQPVENSRQRNTKAARASHVCFASGDLILPEHVPTLIPAKAGTTILGPRQRVLRVPFASHQKTSSSGNLNSRAMRNASSRDG